ncbi:hypothetical protein EV356DRAFT_279833 [Viridothelium virens]|uniref:Resolvase HTH domain-containing protein n=1 Tax=Viridothelium virens TaxID=1048519 RepID=A0A6A6H174_VIRVR|nr:hypothetical protein EV356DRAFT_279833 [Viridothelium virens]
MRPILAEISGNRAQGAEPSKESRAAILAAAGAEKSKAEFAREIGCSRSTVYDTIKCWN